VPVNQSDEAFFVGRDPAFMIFIDVPLSSRGDIAMTDKAMVVGIIQGLRSNG